MVLGSQDFPAAIKSRIAWNIAAALLIGGLEDRCGHVAVLDEAESLAGCH